MGWGSTWFHIQGSKHNLGNSAGTKAMSLLQFVVGRMTKTGGDEAIEAVPMGCNQLVGEDLSSPLVKKWVIVPYEDPLEFSP